MKRVEYVLSLLLALLLLGGAVVWTQATQNNDESAMACRPGSPLVIRGISVLPRCPMAKRG